MITGKFTSSLIAAAGLALTLGGCGTDDPDKGSSNRGGDGQSGDTSVENAYIVPAYALSCALQVDAPAQLSFTVTNNNSVADETLSQISTPVASSVEIEAPAGALTIAPGATLAAGQPAVNPDEPAAVNDQVSVSLLGLTEGVVPGESVPVAFTFERAGEIEFNVAVEACPAQST
jgi:copper(I)-binding protein